MGTNFPGYRNPKRLVAILIFIILKINIFSYEMEILPEILISGRVITLKVDTGIKEGDFIEIEDVEFPEDLILISKPTLRIYYGKIDGKNARLYQVNWALRSRKSGVFELPE
ncbi:MAG: hypothetical protein JXR64_04580, partial [Spirochaetales bacterium]|nr:hypothetical protein [Spirochaetales bacterium]